MSQDGSGKAGCCTLLTASLAVSGAGWEDSLQDDTDAGASLWGTFFEALETKIGKRGGLLQDTAWADGALLSMAAPACGVGATG